MPVAGFNPAHTGPVFADAIKIHPRYTGMEISGPTLGNALAAAGAHDLAVFFCTYQHSAIQQYPSEDPFFSLVAALKAAPRTKLILVHGGDVQLLKYAELVRFNPNLLLDLSLTIMKYAGSSLDRDIFFLFRQFDRRICVGSDHPEYGHHEVRNRFEELAWGVPRDKIENIAFRNILRFIGWGDRFPSYV
jgi:predicted TIM-barrel fold metal-dependent hydrolase